MIRIILIVLASLVVVTALALVWGQWSFHRMVRQELAAFWPENLPEGEMVTPGRIAHLPAPVQRWLVRSGVLGREEIRLVHLRQRGEMLNKPGGSWMPVASEQYFRTAEPGFIWIADVRMMPLLHLAGRDMYQDGRGRMVIKLASLLPIVNASGAEADQGTLLRWLAETGWFPSAALSPHITWEAVDSLSARATMRYGGITAAGVFTFTPDGDFSSFLADRYYYRKEGSTLEPWLVRVEEGGYGELGGIRMPVRCSVTWRLKEGDYTWYKLVIESAEYDEAVRRP
ncbi:MAG TPA: hypothetical protein PKI62_02280 [bacterium]|nr:hypothetical protein [bacterium]